MPDHDTGQTLVKLSESRLTLLRPEEDVRDRAVIARDGEQIGTVDSLYLDEREAEVRFLDVASGGILGIGAKHFLVPVDAIMETTDDAVRVDLAPERAREVPTYDPDLAEAPDASALYGWYGYPPYWAPGYTYPAWPGPPR